MITPDDLLSIPEFSDLDLEDRTWLADRMEEGNYEVGDPVHEIGAEATHMWVFLEGAFRFDQLRQGRFRLYQTFRAPRISGLLPYSRMTHLRGRSVVLERTRIAALHKDHFREMLYRLPEVGSRLVALLSERVRSTAFGDQQREKLMSLGRLSAGLAHEINNPAGAVSRAVPELRKRFDDIREATATLVASGVPVNDLREALASISASGVAGLSTLEQADAEERLAAALEAHGVDEAWELASGLSELGLSPADVDRVGEVAGVPVTADLLRWLVASLDARRLVDEVHAASQRITDLVASIKSYSRMDRDTERQPVQVVEGIDSALRMLGPRLRERKIRVERDTGDELPPIDGLPGELNQVWMNLVENALDAMQPGGRLRIGVHRDAHWLVVEVEDDGEGIPEEAQAHVFEPFFTTKPTGQGTGLGLEIAYRIVVHQHGGGIGVESRPGRTVFTVHLPIVAGQPGANQDGPPATPPRAPSAG